MDVSKLRRGLDVFALTDADTDEAKGFTTYLGYWVALGNVIDDLYGNAPFAKLLDQMEALGLRKLTAKPAKCDLDVLRGVLLNAWSSELALYLVDLQNAERLWLANQWGQVYSYYATSRAASAWLLVRDGHAPDTHAGLLKAMAAQTQNTRYFPSPWNLACDVLKPSPGYLNFPVEPKMISNLASGADDHDRLGMMLRTTRDKDIRKLVEQEKKSLKRKKAPKGCFERHDGRVAPTTAFNFTWRTRTRSNYGDPALFYVGTLDASRSVAFASAIRTFTSATMFLLEALVAQKAKQTLVDAAVHFIARDRAKLADDIIVPRLQTLGLI